MHELLIEQLERYVPQSEAEACDRETMLDFLRTHDDALLRSNRLAHFTASAWIVNRQRTKVLMAFHNLYQSWAWMGGHADGDGDLARVIRKEIAEECGLTRLKSLCDGIYGVQIIHVDHHIKRGSYVGTHLHLDVEYLFEADETDEVRIKEDENSGVGWIPIDRLAEFVSEEHMLPIYAWLNQKLNFLGGFMKIYYETDHIRIRDMTAADGSIFVAEERAQGWHASIGKYENRLRHQAEGRAAVLTAEYDGHPAGYVSVYRRAESGPFAGKGWPEIVDLGVLQKYQRRGIGKALMDAAERIAAASSDTVCLAVGLHSGYGNAQRLYVQRGYLPDGSGAWYGSSPCPQYADCRNDDDLVLFLYKEL